MPIITVVGRKRFSSRLLFAAIYALLIAGGITMLYPFLLMAATSLTDQTDSKEFRLVPRYFLNKEAQYQKFLGEKYQRANDYSDLHAHTIQAFDQAAMPPHAPQPRRVELWREFQATLRPIEFGVWHVGRRTMPGKAEMLWRDYLRAAVPGGLSALSGRLGRGLAAFSEVFAPYEKPDGRLWPGVQGEEGRLWADFKRTLDPRYRWPVDGTVLWRNYLRFKYEHIADVNRALGTAFGDFRQVPLPRHKPTSGMAKEWTYFVRNELPYRFVAIRDGDARYRAFLADAYGPLAKADAQLGTRYASGADIHWPPDRPGPGELDAVSAFLRTGCDDADLSIATPDLRYADFLREKGAAPATFDDIRPPYEEEDLWEFDQDKSQWMSWFLTRNYGEVIDYIAVRGRALWNTLILVGAMILCSLTVNPLAAYALSRFRLSFTNQVLLFLLATMAFPYEVAMIPNFLLLRQFPLWAWLVGGAFGLGAAALVYRATRGRTRLLAIPSSVGAALLAGFFVTPLIGRLFGVPVGPISLLNTFAALILPSVASGFGIFLLKGFFDSLPEELFEAARIDGAGELRTMWHVAFPLSKPILAVMALQAFTATYGSYLWALVVCQDDKMWTLMVCLFQLQQWAPQHITMAATVIASLPTLIVFVFAQKVILRGIIIPAFK